MHLYLQKEFVANEEVANFLDTKLHMQVIQGNPTHKGRVDHPASALTISTHFHRSDSGIYFSPLEEQFAELRCVNA